jgi:dienelactone hydrolase
VKVYTWPAGHGFACDERASYDATCTEKALKITLDFFKANLEN